MKIVWDGGVCFDRMGSCFEYYTQMAPRFAARSLPLTFTPSPTGALDALEGTAEVQRPLFAGKGRWIPDGKLRGWLSRQKKRLEALSLHRKLKTEHVAFQSFYYGLPPDPRWSLIAMVHDLIPEKFPDLHPHDEGLRERKRETVARAAHILVWSQNTRRDLCDHFGADPKDISVIPFGIDAAKFSKPRRNGKAPDFAYFLQVGGRQKHRNFERLLGAYHLLGKDVPHLVCAGENWEKVEADRIRQLRLHDRVHLVHRPTQEHLIALYQNAQALIYPSFYEGFGVPPLEAMAAGLPVAAAAAASIPEVVGDAAELFDPFDVDAIAEAMRAVLSPTRLKELKALGLERVKLFDWENVADQTAEVYRNWERSLESAARVDESPTRELPLRG